MRLSIARQVADTAAERDAADAGGRDDAGGRRQPVLAGRAIQLAQRGPAADANGARCRVDLDLLEQREVEHDAIVDGAEPGAVVAAAANRKR
jgi:hypothetical protein